MTEADALAELTRLDGEFGQMAEGERRHFENLLYLRAMIHGWTDDPLCQPATSVLAAYRQMRTEREEADTDMRQTSVYCIECLCGRHIETESAELNCPTCGGKLRIEWDAEAQAPESKLEPKSIPAAA